MLNCTSASIDSAALNEFHFENIDIINNDEEDQEETNELRILLRNWKLEMLFDHLLAEKVSIDVLKIINPRFVDSLLRNHPVGVQALFDYHLEQWREENGNPNYSNENNSKSVNRNFERSDSSTSSARFAPYSRPDTPEDNISLVDILSDSVKGNMLIEFYNKTGKFQDDQRTILINMICQYYNNRNLHMSLGQSKRMELQICERFQSEKLDYYRVGKRGTIYNRMCNLKSSLKSLCSNENVEHTDLSKELSPEPNADICERSLKFDNLSAEEFDRAWQAFSRHRINQIISLSSTHEVMKKWPFYKKPDGYRLIDMDFMAMFNKQTGILEKWEGCIMNLLNFLHADRNIKDRSILSLLQQLKNNNNISENSRNATILWSLHGYMVPTQKTVSKDNSGKKKLQLNTQLKIPKMRLFLLATVCRQLKNKFDF